MKKPLKILAIVLGALAALLVIAAVVLPFFIDPNQYKGEIIKAVKEQTGRDLKIEGKIGLSLFPWLGLEVTGVELSNAPGFGRQPFARVAAAGVKVEVLPLLRKEIAVDTVMLDGLKLNLARNAAGKTNWDDLTKPAKKEERPPAAAPAPAKPAEGVGIAGFSVQKVDIRRADITWQDLAAGTAYAVHNLELKTGKIVGGKPVYLHLALDLEGGAAGGPKKEAPSLRTRVELAAQVRMDPDGQELDVSNLSLAMAGMALNATIKGRKIFDAPSFSGDVEISPFNLRALLDKLGVKYATADKNALAKAALKSQFTASNDHVRLQNLGATLDDSRVSGSFELRHFARPAYRFDLALNDIDVDRYLPPPAPAAKGAGPGSGKQAAPEKPVEIPLSLLRALDVQGGVRIAKLKAVNLRSSDIVIKIAAKDGLISLGPNEAKLYGGRYAGRTILDARTSKPAFRFDEQLSKIQLGPFLKDAGVFDKYSGTAELGLKLAAQGADERAIKQTLNGVVNISARDGKIEGVNLQKMILEARRLYDQARGKPVRITAAATDETAFSRLSANVNVVNGVARNDDLILEGPVVRAGGQGTADLVRETLDYRLKVTLAEEASKKGSTVPIHIGGTFAKPEYNVDLGEVIKQQAEKAIEKKLEEGLKKKGLEKLFKRR